MLTQNRNVVISSVALILAGCITNNFTLELLMREDPAIGNLLTLLQFIAVGTVGFFLQFDENYTFQTRRIPIKFYLLLTFIFFSLSVINNKAFAFEISQPVHMVFRSSSLLASLLLGLFFFKGTGYSKRQIVGVIGVTVGITVVTFAEGYRKMSDSSECSNCNGRGAPIDVDIGTDVWSSFTKTSLWFIGLVMLTVALMFSALLGHVQEYTFRTYAANWKESLFYTHLIGIGYFIFTLKDLQYHWDLCNNSAQYFLTESISMPIMWWYLLLNCVTQYPLIL